MKPHAAIVRWTFALCAVLVSACSSGVEEVAVYNGTASPRVPEAADDRPVVLFLGDSLTSGYHLDPEEAYPAHIQRRIDEEDLGFRVVNVGVSGDTTIDGLNRLDWLLADPADVLVLALGANDALRGQPLSHTEANLRAILERTRERTPRVRFVIAGMQMPANYGEPYRSAFAELFVRLAEEYDAVLISFLLDGVAGDPERNLPDGIHPTAEGHRIIAETVWMKLAPVLRAVE